MNLGRYISRSAMFWADREAVVCNGRRWSYQELDSRTNRLANALVRHGLRPGDAVATYASNCVELVEAEVAAYKAGLLRVPMNFRLSAHEASHVLEDSGARVLFVDEERWSDLQPVKSAMAGPRLGSFLIGATTSGGLPGYEEFLANGSADPLSVGVDESDPCVLNYTSGSTGSLKAAIQTVGNRHANLHKRLSTPLGGFTSADRYLVTGPITHASGMGVLACLFRGGAVVVMPRWSAEEFVDVVRTERITSTFLVPTMLNNVLALPAIPEEDIASLRCVRVGGAPVSPQRLREAVNLFGPIVLQSYGQGETTSGVTVLTSEDIIRGLTSDSELLSSCGRAMFDSEVQVVDEKMRVVPSGERGEIAVRGPDCVSAYWHEPELSARTFRDGWVLTGDVGYMRDDGYLFIVDRKKEMIVSGGFNVYSSEVENQLYAHPGVSEACVIGVPDEKWGEAVKAFVVLKPQHRITERELIDFCAQRLGRYKKPQVVEIINSLPLNRSGKIDRGALKQRHWSGAPRGVN